MIETWEQFCLFCNESANNDLLFHTIPLSDELHPAINSSIIVFIKDLKRNKIFYYGINHPDIKSLKSPSSHNILNMLSSMKGTKWAVDKKSFDQMVPISGTIDVGMAQHIYENKVFEISDYETSAHVLIRKNFSKNQERGKLIPLMKHLELFTELSETCEKIIKKFKLNDSFLQFNKFIIEPLTELERNGLCVDASIFKTHFGDVVIKSGLIHTQYNFYTATGRPSNRFGGINYAALNKEDGSRKSFISRFGDNGRMVLIDYSAFHPRIIARLTNHPIPTNVDIYEYLAKLYFNKKSVDQSAIADAKQITFRQLYGGVEEKYRHIKYLSHLKEFIDGNWNFFKEHGYIETPIFKRHITEKHLQNTKPATVFNYLLQAAEGEISIPILGQINEYLKSFKTKAVLYTYDSILFDYCLDDGQIMPTIKQMMSIDGAFPMKWYIGENYHDLELLP